VAAHQMITKLGSAALADNGSNWHGRSPFQRVPMCRVRPCRRGIFPIGRRRRWPKWHGRGSCL